MDYMELGLSRHALEGVLSRNANVDVEHVVPFAVDQNAAMWGIAKVHR
jgi:hypothetical protein